MPTYVYECKECQKSVELIQKISERQSPTCECGKVMESVIQATTFVLKGSGWAKDGYGSSGKK